MVCFGDLNVQNQGQLQPALTKSRVSVPQAMAAQLMMRPSTCQADHIAAAAGGAAAAMAAVGTIFVRRCTAVHGKNASVMADVHPCTALLAARHITGDKNIGTTPRPWPGCCQPLPALDQQTRVCCSAVPCRALSGRGTRLCRW